ncbi:MAG: hypothetical protein JNL61_17205 [Rhizobiaceae bacterium]|nr:hypothetical protein [Rhizobiaceae bacterium]
MTKYDIAPRLSLSAIDAADEAAVATAREWTQRAQNLAAFAMANLSPDLPPITAYISSIENNSRLRKIR